MKKIFYVVVVAVVLFAVKSCGKDPDPDPDPGVVIPQPPVEDTSGLCKIIFVNTDSSANRYSIFLDNIIITAQSWGETQYDKDSVQAGTRTLYAEQQSGQGTGMPKKKTSTVKILTDSTYIWEFP